MPLELNRLTLALIDPDRLMPTVLSQVPYVSLKDDVTVRLRDNSLMSCIRLTGRDAMTSDEIELAATRRAIASTLAQIGEAFTIYVHKISRPLSGGAWLPPVQGYGFAAEIDQRWRRYLDQGGFRDRSLTISVVRHGARFRGPLLSSRHSRRAVIAQDEIHSEQLGEVVRALRSAIGAEATELLSASQGRLLGFLNATITGRERRITPAKGVSVLGDDIATERVTFERDRIVLSEGGERDRYGVMRSLKGYGAASWVTVFDELVVPCDFVITQSFTSMAASRAAEVIARQRRRMRATADARISACEQLGMAEEEVISRTLALGLHHMTVCLFDPDGHALREHASNLETSVSAAGYTLVRDSIAQRANFFSQLPGNREYRTRKTLITNENFADFASLHRSNMGKAGDEVPWAAPISILPTLDGSLRRFHFHAAGSPEAAPTAGHSIVIGKTGSGKSVLAGFLMAGLHRMKARLFVFDYRRGLEMATRALGGSYSSIAVGQPTGLNPLQVETDAEGISFLADWIGHLLRANEPLSAAQSRQILDVVRRNAEQRPELQIWGQFETQFASLDDGGKLHELVSEWGPSGRFGWVFGKTLRDSFSLEGDVLGFDLTDVMDSRSDHERMAVLSYLFRRLERQLQDGRPTVVVIDEAWKAVDNDYFADKIKDWLVTLRKLNTVVVMMTQNPAQLASSRVGADIFASFTTQVLFPNPQATPSDYAPLRLNAAETAFVTSPARGRSVLVRDDTASTVIRADLSPLGRLVHVLGGGAAGEAVVGADWKENAQFWEAGR